MRSGIQLRAVISVGLALVVLLSPLSATAATDCSALQQRVAVLDKEARDIQNELDAALRRLGDAQNDMARLLKEILDTQAKLKDEPDKVRQELEDKGFHDAVHALGTQIGIALVVALFAPELELDTGLAAIELADKVLTITEIIQLLREAAEANSVLQEMANSLGGSDALAQFADENNLTELQYLINQEAYLVSLQKDFAQAYSRWENAAADVIEYDAELAQKQRELQQAAAALYDCLAQRAAEPPCAAATANPGEGAGVCR